MLSCAGDMTITCMHTFGCSKLTRADVLRSVMYLHESSHKH